jgi:hypothetical protein
MREAESSGKRVSRSLIFVFHGSSPLRGDGFQPTVRLSCVSSRTGRNPAEIVGRPRKPRLQAGGGRDWEATVASVFLTSWQMTSLRSPQITEASEGGREGWTPTDHATAGSDEPTKAPATTTICRAIRRFIAVASGARGSLLRERPPCAVPPAVRVASLVFRCLPVTHCPTTFRVFVSALICGRRNERPTAILSQTNSRSPSGIFFEVCCA